MSTKAEIRKRAIGLMRASPPQSDRAIARQLGVSNKTISRWRIVAGPARPPEPLPGLPTGELLARLVEYGVSPTQFTRWRQAGLLPQPTRRWRAGGSDAVYPPEVLQQARHARQLIARYRNLDDAALGLLAYGWPVREDRWKAAYTTWLDDRQAGLAGIERIIHAPADETWDDPFDILAGELRSSRRFRTLRQTAPREPGEDADAAAWRHLTRIVGILIYGRLDDEHEVAEVLAPTFLGDAMDSDDIRYAAAVHESLSLPTLRRVLASADAANLGQACDEVVIILTGLVVLVDGDVAMTEPPNDRPARLSAYFDHDPALLARLGLMLTSIKQHPEIGGPVSRWLNDLTELGTERVEDLVSQLAGAGPWLQALTGRALRTEAVENLSDDPQRPNRRHRPLSRR